MRLSLHPGVAGMTHLPAFTGGTSCFALLAEDLRMQDMVEGIVLDNISFRSSKLNVNDKGV